MADIDGTARIRSLTTPGVLKNDASGNITTTLPAITTSGANTTLDYSAQTVKHKTTDEFRIETGSANHLSRWLTTGAQRRPQLIGNPSSFAQGDEWFNISAIAPQWTEGSTASDVRTAASLEKDVIGNALGIVSGSTHTPGSNNFFWTYDATSNSQTVTLGGTLLEGREYLFRCRNNATNTVTFSADTGGGYVLYQQLSNTATVTSIVCGASGTGLLAPYNIYKIRRIGQVIIFMQ